jgi:spore coat protein U-like protein
MKTSIAALPLLLGLLAGRAEAGACNVSSSGLAFGAYQPLTFPGKLASSAATSDARVDIACTGIVGGGSYTVGLGPSSAGGGDRISVRYLAGSAGGDDMAFNVYLDPAHTQVWGDGIVAGSLMSGTIAPGDSNQSQTVYGRVPAGQNTLRAGSYSGWLTMTISYNP